MDLIYTNSSREDVGVLLDYELDLAFGADENNFECTIQASSHCCEAGSLLYFEGTEYGGVVDSIESNGSTQEVVYSGRTWHGVMNSKVIAPDSGEDYLIVSGEANTVIGTLLTRMGIADLFEASSANSGLNISNYKMNRYIKGYDGITKMLASVGARIHVIFRDGKVVVSAVKKRDYSENEEFDSDQVGFTAKKNFRAVNHLICLGAGNLSERLVVHLYADKNGNISQTQTQFGIDEVSDTYERSDLATEEELLAEGKTQLKSIYDSDEVSIDFDAESDAYEVGDVVGAYDNITGLYITTTIAKKIVTIKNGNVTISLTPDTANGRNTSEVVSGGGSVTPSEPGASGGYYTPVVQQTDTDEVTFGFVPSDSAMPVVNPTTVNLPQGIPGDPGGYYSPGVIMSSEETMVVRFTGSTDELGFRQFTVPLPRGYTPVRGTDYWTAADIQSMVTEAVNGVLQQKSTILEAAYPVGAIYMSAVATNPATLFGFGTWEQIKDKFLLSAGDTYAAGATGGSKAHKHTYGLKVYEYYSMAAFNPKGGLTGAINIDDGSLGTWTGGSSMAGTETLNASLGTTTASANPHHYESRATTSTETNMPPYLAVYVWKRTA